jgi:hypothetical protein
MFGSRSNIPAPPPEVPEEFADTYRKAYEAALSGVEAAPAPIQAAPPASPQAPPAVPTQRRTDADPGGAPATATPTFVPAETEPQGVRLSGPLFADEGPVTPTGFWGEMRRSPLFVPVLIALVAFLVISGIYFLGFGAPDSDSSSTQPQPSTPYDGQVSWQHDLKASGTCGRGKQVGANAPGRAVDGRIATAWVCHGLGVGMTLRIELPEEVEIGQVGLIPGQARADLYASGNLISRVRWKIGKNVVTQNITGARADSRVRHLRIPATRARTIELEILEITKGKRNQTSISEVVIGATD